MTNVMKRLLVMGCSAMMVGALQMVGANEGKPTPTPAPVTGHDASEATAEATAAFENRYAGIPFSRTEDGAPVLGDPTAPITIVQFADYACPHCQRYEPVMQEFIETYVATGRAQYEFRYFPTMGGEMTAYIANLTSCFENQQPGVFWPLHDALYEQAMADQYDTAMLRKLARRFGLNFLDAQTCISDSIESLQSDTDWILGHINGVDGTPAIRVRYKDHNNGDVQYLVVDGVAWDTGGAPLEWLAQAVEDAEAGRIPDADIKPELPLLPGDPV